MGALDARVVVVGQDFSGTDRGWTAPNLDLPTNKNLRKFVRAAGLDERRDVYLTNAILCMKPGGTSAGLRAEWVRNCAPHLRRTVEIVAPLAVAALGVQAWGAVGKAFGVKMPQLTDCVGQSPLILPGGLAAFAFNHPGGLGLVRRGLADQTEDWRKLGGWFAARQVGVKPEVA